MNTLIPVLVDLYLYTGIVSLDLREQTSSKLPILLAGELSTGAMMIRNDDIARYAHAHLTQLMPRTKKPKNLNLFPFLFYIFAREGERNIKAVF